MSISGSVSIGPSGAPLILEGDCVGEGLFWNGIALPDWAMRLTTAPPSAWVAGNVLMSAVPDSGTVLMSVVAKGNSLAGMEAQKALLADALTAWPGEFKIEVTDSGLPPQTEVIAGPWQTYPTIPRWGIVSYGHLHNYVSETAFELPVNPVGAP